MSLLGFWSAVWGWNRPPQSSSSSARPLRASPRQRMRHTSSFNCSTLNPSFFIYHHIPFHPPAIILFSLSLSTFALFCFTPSPSCMNISLPTIIARLTLPVQEPPPQLLSLAKSYLQPGFACFSVGSWGPCDAPALPVASIVQ